MATYVIGDLQGCWRTLQNLLGKIRFRPERDRIWLVGDIVNRGPGSLEALRWAKGLGEEGRLTAVLGNHDLHLLCVAHATRELKSRDTLAPVLEADDRDELLGWLARRPLLHREGQKLLVHAGLLPSWTVETAEHLAREAESALSGRRLPEILKSLDTPEARWDDRLTGIRRVNALLQIFTNIRACTAEDDLCLDYSGPPEKAPRGCIPWYQVPGRRSADHTIYFGHWAALGLFINKRLRALESGAVWGNQMTAFRLEDERVFQVPCAEPELK